MAFTSLRKLNRGRARRAAKNIGTAVVAPASAKVQAQIRKKGRVRANARAARGRNNAPAAVVSSPKASAVGPKKGNTCEESGNESGNESDDESDDESASAVGSKKRNTCEESGNESGNELGNESGNKSDDESGNNLDDESDDKSVTSETSSSDVEAVVGVAAVPGGLGNGTMPRAAAPVPPPAPVPSPTPVPSSASGAAAAGASEGNGISDAHDTLHQPLLADKKAFWPSGNTECTSGNARRCKKCDNCILYYTAQLSRELEFRSPGVDQASVFYTGNQRPLS